MSGSWDWKKKPQQPWLSLEEGRVGTSPGCLRSARSPQASFSLSFSEKLWLPKAVLLCAGLPCLGLSVQVLGWALVWLGSANSC